MANIEVESSSRLPEGFGARNVRPLTARLAERFGRFNVEGMLVLIALVIAWQVASLYYPPILFPSLERIGAAFADLLTSPTAANAAFVTYVRILVALLVGFAIATILGIAAGMVRSIERATIPLIEVMQGIPAVCWIIFAILWFRDMEVRTAFVVIVTTIPSFFYQARDGVLAISGELWDMVRSLRPSLPKLVRILIVPALLPALLTGWRINIGNGTRVTIMAELLGGVSGIGHQLRLAQEMFRMDKAIAWTVVLVAFVVVSNLMLSWLEKRLLGWRAGRREAA
jgi:ABC-type nitrate/sulfonate/bicarbonate transport system permease component